MRRRSLLSLAAGAATGLPALAATPVRTRVETALGSFLIEVDPAFAPVTVTNYLRYVDGGYLDKSSVYRIVTLANQSPETKHKIEVIQWGMKLEDDQNPPFPPIAHETTRETGLRHLDGTVSMARSKPGTAAGEFFICIGDQPELDYGGRRNPDGQGFAAFGKVVEGRDTLKALFGRAEAEQFLKTPIAVTRVRRI